jgi:hypothetical protein
MRSLLIVLSFLFSINLLGQSAAHVCADSKIKHFTKLNKMSKINYPGDDRIDVSFYKLDLTLSYEQRKIWGKVTIKAKSVTDNLTNAFFDLQNYYTITSVTQNNKTVAYNFTNDKITAACNPHF